MFSRRPILEKFWSFQTGFFALFISPVLALINNYLLLYHLIRLAVISRYLYLFVSFLGLFLVIPSLSKNVWMPLTHIWKAKEVYTPSKLSDLAEVMGVENFSLKTRDDIKNAYVLGRDLVFGKPLLQFPEDQVLAIIAHEFEHLRSKHSQKYLAACIVYTIIVYNLSNSLFALPLTMKWMSMCFLILFFLKPILWFFEFNSDKASAEVLGAESMINALLALSEGEDRNRASLSHPSINERIKKLRSY